MVAHVPGSGCCDTSSDPELWHLTKEGTRGTGTESACGALGYITTAREQVTCQTPECQGTALDEETAQIADAVADRIAARLGGRVMPATLPPELLQSLRDYSPDRREVCWLQYGNSMSLRFTLWVGRDGQLYGDMMDGVGRQVWSGVWGPAGG